MTSVKVTREREWDADEQAWMLALHLYRALLAPCGHYMPHTAAPEAEDRYVAGAPSRCHACTAVAVTAESYKDSPHRQALLFQAERR